MQYIVLDLEWNQAISKEQFVTEPVKLRGEIVQLGAVKLDEKFNTVDTFKIMISPRYYKIMNYKVRELTGIKTSDIRRGFAFPLAFGFFKKWCGQEYAILTWGCDDIPMLKDNMTLHGMDAESLPPYYDVQPIFDSQITKEKRQHSLTSAMELLGEPPFEAHDALNDALSTAAVCRHLDMEAGFFAYEDLTRSTKLPTVSRSFTKFSEILKDEEVNTFVCPECRKLLHSGEWASCRRGKLMAKLDCECGEKYMAFLFCIKNKDGTYRVGRKMPKREESDDEYYEKKRAQNEEWRKKRMLARA